MIEMKQVLMMRESRSWKNNMPESVSGYIFPIDFFDEADKVFDFRKINDHIYHVLKHTTKLDLYVMDPDTALAAIINYCAYNRIQLTLWYYNNKTNGYYPQTMSSTF